LEAVAPYADSIMPSSTEPKPEQVYQAFLLRCWLIPSEEVGELPVWRFELLEVSAELSRHRFTELAQLQTFVAGRLTAVVKPNDPPDPPALSSQFIYPRRNEDVT
jgi:hypothetical protein